MSKSSRKRSAERVALLLNLYRTDRVRFDLELRRRIQAWLHVALKCTERAGTREGRKRSFGDFVTSIEWEIKALTDAEQGLSRLTEVGPLLRSVATHARAREFDSRLYHVTVNLQLPARTR